MKSAFVWLLFPPFFLLCSFYLAFNSCFPNPKNAPLLGAGATSPKVTPLRAYNNGWDLLKAAPLTNRTSPARSGSRTAALPGRQGDRAAEVPKHG